jgi:hypothetical protein
VTYQFDDAQTRATLPDRRFDSVACASSLTDIDDLRATLAAAHRVLKFGGWFVFVIPHLCTITRQSRWTTPPVLPGLVVSGAFPEGHFVIANAPRVRGKVSVYHRTLSIYLNALVEAGFTTQRISEPLASEETAEQLPGATESPAILAVRRIYV